MAPLGKKVKFPLHPAHPERICWGCDRFCPADDLACGNGSERILHPAELFGPEWYLSGDWSGLIEPEVLNALHAIGGTPRSGSE